MRKITQKYCIINDEIISSDDIDKNYITRGTSIYEVIRVIDGIPLFFEEHIVRFLNSAKIVNLKLWLDKNQIEEKIIQLIRINNVKNGNVKLVFNYFTQNHKLEKVFSTFFIQHHYPSEAEYKTGVPVMLFRAERNNPNAKIISVDFSKTTDEIIKRNKVYEVILVDNDGNITEGSKSNIFMINKNNVYTSISKDILSGITRKYVIKICKDLGLNIIKKKISAIDIMNLDATFITGTSPKILPICKIDDINYASENIYLHKIILEYNKIINNYINNK